MWWFLILLIVVIASFAVPKFGKTLLVVIGILMTVGFAWYLKNQHEEKISKQRISPSEIQFDDLRMAPRYSPESFRLLGRIKNKSQRYTLHDIQLKVTIRDCIKAGDCEIVGEATAWSFNNIPPGQSREFDESVYFSNLAKPKGKYEWDYSVVEIKGE